MNCRYILQNGSEICIYAVYGIIIFLNIENMSLIQLESIIKTIRSDSPNYLRLKCANSIPKPGWRKLRIVLIYPWQPVQRVSKFWSVDLNHISIKKY